MTIYNLKDKLEYLDEVARLEYEEWADNKINIVFKNRFEKLLWKIWSCFYKKAKIRRKLI